MIRRAAVAALAAACGCGGHFATVGQLNAVKAQQAADERQSWRMYEELRTVERQAAWLTRAYDCERLIVNAMAQGKPFVDENGSCAAIGAR